MVSMAKDPAVLFYTSDFLSGTAFFTDEQVGQYIRLLCQQHQLGNIPEFQIIKVCGSIDSPVIKKFKKDSDGAWFNERMKYETERRSNYSLSRSKNIGKRWGKNNKPLSGKKIDIIHMNNHMNIHMENENENRNKDVLYSVSLKSEEKLSLNIPDHLKEIWPDFLSMRKAIRKPATQRAQKNLLNELNTLAPNNTDLQIKIVEQSITQSWQGVFELKTNNQNQRKKYEYERGTEGKYDNLQKASNSDD